MAVNKVTLLQEAILSLNKEINKNGEATKKQRKELEKLEKQYEKLTGKIMPQYRKKHDEVIKALENSRKFTQEATKANQGFSAKLKTAIGTLTRYGIAYKIINSVQRVFTELTVGSVKQSIAFEKALANLGAVAGATSEEVEKLGKNALGVAGATKFTATEIVSLQTELSKLGFTADDVVASTQAIAFTAQALGAPLDTVAQQTGKVINQFDLLIEQAGFVGDVLVTSINNSALSFDSFGTAIQYVGPIAKNLGLTFEQTAGAMAVLADNGFTASRVGTGLRGIFTELGKTSADVQASLNSLAEQNISLSEAVDLVGKRNAAQLITLLKNIDAIDEGNEKYYEQGRALQSAAKQVDNFAGQMDLLNSAFREFQINIGESISNSDILLSVLDAFFPAAGKTARGFQAINEVGFEAFNDGAKEVEKGAGSLNKSLELLGISQEEYQQSLEALNRTETSFLDYLPDGFSKIGDAALAQVQKVDGFRIKLEEVAEESKKQTLITEGQTIATDEYEESVRRLTQAFEDQINVNDEVDATADRINSQISEYNAIIKTGIRTQTDAFGIRSEMVEVTEDEILKYKGLVGALQGYLDQLTNISFSEDELNKKREKERQKAVKKEKENVKQLIKIENDAAKELVNSINERAKQQTAIAETAEERADIEAKRQAAVSEAYKETAKTIAGIVPVYEENINVVENAVKANEKLSKVLGSEVINDLNKAFKDYSGELNTLKKALDDGTIGQEDYERSISTLRTRFIKTIETFKAFAGTSPELETFFENLILNFDAASQASTEMEKTFGQALKTELLDSLGDALDTAAESISKFNDVALENTKNRLDAEKQAISNRYETENDILKSQLDNQLITESQFRVKQKELQKAKVAEENDINRKIFEAEKKRDRQNATTDYAQAIASIIPTLIAYDKTADPISVLAKAAITGALATASYGAELAAIGQKKFFPTKFAEGGMVNGPSHDQGGVPFSVQGQGGYEMEGGEYIVNKRATSMHRDLLERINKTGRLNPTVGRMKFAEGGLVSSPMNESVDYLKAIAEATTSTAIGVSKPVRAYVADKDLRTDSTERRIRDRNDRI